MKKSQVTIFIILGLVLLLSAGIFLYYASESAQEIQEIPETIDAGSLTEYTGSCLKAVGEEVITKVALQGGMYEPAYYKIYENTSIEYWCYGEGTQQCVNAVISTDAIADQILYGIREEIESCLNFQTFEEQGYKITKGIFEGTVSIIDDAVEVQITYPLKVSKDKETTTVENFETKIAVPLGELQSIARMIINKESTDGSFDVTNYLINHTQIHVSRAKPYPATIYTLQKQGSSFQLQIAVQGMDTVENPGEIRFGGEEPIYGCCYVGLGQSCYANTPSTVCEERNGIYETAPCTCNDAKTEEQDEETLCNGGECRNCGTYRHAESWCAYDAQTGEGKDVVGSRHVLYSCINGETIVDPCRDYREEICVQGESLINGRVGTTAVCRPNRWQDCSQCTTESCCENTEERDCYWNAELEPLREEESSSEATAQTQCTPYVPPGFKFWNYNGIEVCSRANAQKTCTGLFCEQDWIDAAAITCDAQGDCGNSQNILFETTKAGFFESNFKYNPSDEIYEVKEDASPITILPRNVQVQGNLLGSPVEETADVFVEMISTAYQFVNQWVGVTVPNYLNPFTKKPKIEVTEMTFCSVWQAPNTKESCSLCEEGNTLCTEYKCKSLGKKCVYEEEDGFPLCRGRSGKEEKNITITFDEEQLSAGYSAEQETLQIEAMQYQGYKITPEIPPYELFSMGIQTNEETICHLDYMPRAELFDAPVFVMGIPEYARAHTLTMRTPPRMEIPEKVKDELNLSTAEQMITALEEPEALLENYEEKFPAVFDVYSTVAGDDLGDVLDPYIDEIEEMIESIGASYPTYKNLSITVMDKFNSGGYYLFMSCEDRYGNTETEELFIDINIANETEDTAAPVIVAASPQDGSFIGIEQGITPLYIYSNEPAECKYDYTDKEYDAMDYALSCKNKQYEFVGVAGGSYLCTTTLATITDTTIYIRCADNPEDKKTYLVGVQSSNTSGMGSELYSEAIPEETENPVEEYRGYINVTDVSEENSSTIFVSSSLLSETKTTIFNVSMSTVIINFFSDGQGGCTMKNETAETIMECAKTEEAQKTLGENVCTATMMVAQDGEMNETNETTQTPQYYEIICTDEEREQHVATASTVYSIKKSSGFEVLTVSPKDNEEVEEDTALTVTTTSSDDISCGYAAYGSLEYLEMMQVTESAFRANLKALEQGYNAFTVFCEDEYGNSAERTVSFYVAE